VVEADQQRIRREMAQHWSDSREAHDFPDLHHRD